MDIPQSAAETAPAKDDPTIWVVDDQLWELIAPLLMSTKPRKKPGRPRRDNRGIFNGLIWIMRTGSQWVALPKDFGPKSTVHERYSEWVATGALAKVWEVVLREYDGEIGLDWSWLAADGCLVKAPAGKKGGPTMKRPRLDPTPPIGPSQAQNGTC